MPRAEAQKGRGRSRSNRPAKNERSRWRHALDIFLVGLSLLCAIALFVTAYGGYLSPLKYGGKVGILPLCFPVVAAAILLLTLIDCFFCRKGAVVNAVAIILCGGPMLTLFPLHIFSPKAPTDAERFTLLSYNVFQFSEREGYPADRSAALDYIFERDADIVCLQEALTLSPMGANTVAKAQTDTLHARYPYVIHSSNGQVIMSKFEVNPIHLNVNDSDFAGGDIGAYRVTLPSGRLVGIFNVHLNSYQLTTEDRSMYKDLTKLRREPIDDIRSQLLSKVSAAALGRARQAQQLIRWLRLYGGPDAIVCGDFNDVTNCYAVHTLSDAGFRDVYSEVGFGPMFTYNANRFYFCIDHILYRGDLKPLWLKKGSLKASDHYPLEAEFVVAGTSDNS